MICGDRRHQGGVTDLQRADAVADRDGPHTVAVGRDFGGHVRQSLLRRGMRGVLQPSHGAPAIVIANHAGESHDGSGRFV
jgi:hypothetical protein